MYEPFGQKSFSKTFGTNSNPGNASDTSMGWASDPNRKVDGLFTTAIIQMGARTYLPSAGRFLQVDPVDGGAANAYTYAGDPINSTDYTGMFIWSGIVSFVKKAVQVITTFIKTAVQVVKTIVKAAGAVAAVVYNNYVKPAVAAIFSAGSAAAGGVATAAKSTFEFVGKHSNEIGISIALAGFVACTVMTVGACAAAGAIALATAGPLAYIGARTEGKSQEEAITKGVVDTALSRVPYGGKGLEAVRWYGKGRQYKSAVSAFKSGQGSINNQAVKRASGQFYNLTGGFIVGQAEESVWK